MTFQQKIIPPNLACLFASNLVRWWWLLAPWPELRWTHQTEDIISTSAQSRQLMLLQPSQGQAAGRTAERLAVSQSNHGRQFYTYTWLGPGPSVTEARSWSAEDFHDWCWTPGEAPLVELLTKVRKYFTIMEKAPTRTVCWLKVSSSAFTFKTLR